MSKFLSWLFGFIKKPFVNLTTKQVTVIAIVALVQVLVAGVLVSPFPFWKGMAFAIAGVLVCMLVNTFLFLAVKRFLARLKMRASAGRSDWIDPRFFCNLVFLGLLWLGERQLAKYMSDLFAWAITVAVFGIIFHQGLRKVALKEEKDNENFAVGLLFVFGNPWPVRVRQGWGFFLFCGFLFDFVVIKVTKINTDIDGVGFTVPTNNVAMTTRVSLTFGVNHQSGRSVFNWQKSGGEVGVKNILSDMTRERTRIWGASDIEGPNTWQEAKRAGDEVVAVLFKRLVGSELTPVDSGKFATTDLLAFTRTPRPKPSDIQKSRCGDDWGDLSAAWNDYNDATETAGPLWTDAFGSITKKALIAQIDERRKDIEKTRTGNGEKGVRDLGMLLYRLNLSDEIKTQDPEIEGLAQRLEKEASEKLREKANLDSRMKQMSDLKAQFPDLGDKGVAEMAQVEADLVKKQIIRVDGGAVPLLHLGGQNSAGGI